jgi:hypothetical protein
VYKKVCGKFAAKIRDGLWEIGLDPGSCFVAIFEKKIKNSVGNANKIQGIAESYYIPFSTTLLKKMLERRPSRK